MPEVRERRVLGEESGGWRLRLSRWFYRNRPRIAVMAAFAVACIIGLAAVSVGVQTLSPPP